MKKLGAFFGVFIIVFAVWQLQAVVFDHAVRFMSFDYVPTSMAFGFQTINRGVFFASLFSAVCFFPARCRVVETGTLAIGVVLLPLVTSFVIIACAGIYHFLFQFGLLDISAWKLAFPNRYAIFLGMRLGFEFGSSLAILISCALVWRARFADILHGRVKMSSPVGIR